MEDSGGSARAVASDSEGRLPSLSEGHPPSDDEVEDVDMLGSVDENLQYGPPGGQSAAAASPQAGAAGLRHGGGGGSGGSIAAQESFLTGFLPHLHALAHADTQGVDLKALITSLNSANNIYSHMIQHGLPETSDTIFLMYSSFFQPLIREVLPSVLQQLLADERQVQLCVPQNAREHCLVCRRFIELCAKYLTLHVRVLQGRELVPSISQRVADDLAPLLRTLSAMFDVSLLAWSPAFQAELPQACWDDVTLGSWAAQPVLQAVAAAKSAAAAAQPAASGVGEGGGQDSGQGAGAGSGGADGEADPSGTESPRAAVSPRQAAAARWQAAFVDYFGAVGGLEVLLQLASQPERLGEHLWAFLMPLACAAPLLLPARRAALLPPAAATVQLVGAGLQAAPDLSALEGGARNAEVKVSQALQLTRSILAVVASPEEAEAQVGPLQREHVLRLLRAPAFTRQLAGVKQLRDLLVHTFFRDRLAASIEALTAWLQQHGVVQLVLKSNLHQAQYAEQAQRVLSTLLQQGHLSDDSIAFLWQLTEDATTFEGVKTNAYGILASLGPHMDAPQRVQLFERLQCRAAASGVAEATSICQLLAGMAQQDTQARMWRDVLDCLLSIQLREQVPPEVAGSQAVVEVCATYDGLLGPGDTPCSQHAARVCIAHLDGPTAVPAAVVLHALLSHIWHKPERMRAIMQQLNPNADLLKRCLSSYEGWLDRQRVALQAAVEGVAAAAAPPAGAAAKPAADVLRASALGAAGRLVAEGPPDGAFSHRAAVDAWMQLTHKVVAKGNFFLLQEQLELMAAWASKHAVCEYDSQQAWQLAARMVADGRKEVQKEVAGRFLVGCLCQLPPSRVTRAAWRCILAYLCALSEPLWETELTDDDIVPANAYVSLGSQEAVCGFLWRSALHTPDSAMAHSLLLHLAFIHGSQLRTLLRDRPQAWQQLVREEAHRRLAQLAQLALDCPGAAEAAPPGPGTAAQEGAAAGGEHGSAGGQRRWFAPPPALPALAGGGEAAPQALAAARQCQRILQYLAMLLEQCQGRRMPCPSAHRSAYQGFELTVNVQLPTQQGQKPLKQELRMPANLPVGELRRAVADWLGKPPQFVRLLGGGREFDNDGHTLASSRAGQQLLMAQLSAKPSLHLGHSAAAEQAAATACTALVEQGEVYRLALALAQPPPAAAAATAPAPAGATAAGSSRLVTAALQLLLALPTCPDAQAQLADMLCQPDGGHRLRAMLAGGPPPGAAAEHAAGRAFAAATAQPPVLMYTMQTLCTLLFPQTASQPAADPARQEEAAAQAAAQAGLLQRRLLLSGSLQVLLELATDAAVAPWSSSGSGGCSSPAADPAVASATHAAMLLLLHRTQEAIDRQQMDAAAAAAELAAANEEQQDAAAVAAGQAGGPASASEPSSMQLDGAASAAAADDGGSSAVEPGGAAGAVPERAASGSAAGPSPSISMAAAASLDGETGTVGDSSGALPAGRHAGAAGVASEAAARALQHAEEVEAAAAALAALASHTVRYVLHMLCGTLGCRPGAPAGAQPAAHAAPAEVEGLPLLELCRQALLLLKHLARHSSAAVEVVTGSEAAAAEAAVRCLLLHPASAQLRQLAADWLPGFAGAAPAAHRWAFERIVQPMLLSVGGSAGSGGGPADAAAGQEQMALCKHFITTLEYSEFPAARQLLDTLLRRLSEAIQANEPIDGIASVVGALIRRLDCREVGLSSGLVSRLINGCCFPALTALLNRETAALMGLQAAGEAQQAAAAAAGGSSDAGGGAPDAAVQQVQHQQQLQAAAAAGAAEAEAERCIAAARLHCVGHGSAGSASREAAFDLLLDLVTHDSGCWRQAQELLQNRVHHVAGQVLLQQFGNVPLQALRAPGAFAGLQNGGATCYMSSVFQQLFMQPTIRRLILSAPGVPPEGQADSVFHQMQTMFAHLALGVEPWFEPRGFWRAFKDYDGQPVNIREHQDAYEFFTRLQDSVDEHLKAQGSPRAIHAALGGTFAQLITVVEAPQHRSERDEEFYQISLDVRGKRTLAESLRSFVCKELMDGQNQYHSEELGKKVDAEKRTLIRQLPHTLVLHLKRFEWDYETYQRWKVKDRFEFPMQLDMYPYTVEGADEADGREPAGKQPPGRYLYDLRGVVVHSGSAFAGHYYSYIKDRGPGGGWFCFDDTSVEPWDPSRLDKDCFGGRFIPEGFTQECDRPNSAYMLFYERAEPEPYGGAARPCSAAAPAGTAAQPQRAPAAPAVEDTPMPTPGPAEGGMLGAAATAGPGSEGAAGAAGAGQGVEGGVQPMALSPAPSFNDRAVEQPPAAAAGTGGGEQPPAAREAQQQGGGPAGAAGARQLAATPAGGHGMPRQLYEAILYSNLRQLSQMQLLSMEYSRFMWNLSDMLEEAVQAGTARKAVKREPTSSPGAMELSAASGSAGGSGGAGDECLLASLTSRRGGDLHAVIADVALLCLDYSLRVALRGGAELRKEVVGTQGRKGTVGMQEALFDAIGRVPTAAQAALLHLSSGPSGMAASVLLVQPGWASVRSFVNQAMIQSLDCTSRQERRTEEAVHAVRALAEHLCTQTAQLALQSSTLHAGEFMAVLARTASPKYPWRRAMLDPHMPTLLALIRKVAEHWASLEPEQRHVQDGARSMLTLLSFLLRRFASAEAAAERSRRKPQRQPGGAEPAPPPNPHRLEACEPVPMPPEVLDWLYADPTFIRKLLLPGSVQGASVLRLLNFLTWNNQEHLRLWASTLLQHMLFDATDWRDLVVELPLLAGVLGLKDGLALPRLISVFWGVEDGPPGILKEMMSSRRGSGCQQILLCLALTLLLEAPQDLAVRLVGQADRWLAWAGKFIDRLEARQAEEEDDDNLYPESPRHEDLAAESDAATGELLSPLTLRERYETLLALLREAQGSDTGSERSRSSGSPPPYGGASGAAGGDWQAGLQQYGEDAPGGSGGLSQQRAAGPGSQGGDGPELRPGGGGLGSGGFLRAADQPELQHQQHISAGFGGEAGEQEAEVIEIHSDQD